jgi:hypothetical protein
VARPSETLADVGQLPGRFRHPAHGDTPKPIKSRKEVSASMDGNINTLFTSLATTIRNVSVAVGVFAFMWGAIQYATSGGSPHQLEVGKAAMKASLIGVGAVVLAATLVGIVFGALGGGAAAAH